MRATGAAVRDRPDLRLGDGWCPVDPVKETPDVMSEAVAGFKEGEDGA